MHDLLIETSNITLKRNDSKGFFLVGVGYNGMPHGCNDDELPWGKSSKADPLDTKVIFFQIIVILCCLTYTNIYSFFYIIFLLFHKVYVCLSCRNECNHEQNFS